MYPDENKIQDENFADDQVPAKITSLENYHENYFSKKLPLIHSIGYRCVDTCKSTVQFVNIQSLL